MARPFRDLPPSTSRSLSTWRLSFSGRCCDRLGPRRQRSRDLPRTFRLRPEFRPYRNTDWPFHRDAKWHVDRREHGEDTPENSDADIVRVQTSSLATQITGTWSSTMAGVSMIGGGTVSGTASGNSVDLTIRLGEEPCVLGLHATVDGRTMSGYLSDTFRCPGPPGWQNGNVTLTRR